MATIILLGATVRPQAQPSAIAVTQVEWAYNIRTRKRQDHYTVRFLEIIPARTAYPSIAERLGQVVENLHTQAAQFAARVVMYVDVTGLGEPVIDLIKAKADPILTVRFSKADKRVEHDDHLTMGKAWLIARLQVLFQGGRIQLPRTEATKQLVEELLAYSLDPAPSDNELTGSLAVGSQDELLTALGLACQGLPAREEAAEEFLEYMRRRSVGIPGRLAASKDWLKEWGGPSPVPGVNPLTGLPQPNSGAPGPAAPGPRPALPPNIVPHG